MKKNLLIILNTPWYFILFAAYPVLALLSYNISQVVIVLESVINNFGCSGGAAVPVLSLGLSELEPGGVCYGSFYCIIYTYGQVFDQIQKKWKVPSLPIWFGVLWLVLLATALVLAGWSRVNFQGFALTLNIISLGLAVYASA